MTLSEGTLNVIFIYLRQEFIYLKQTDIYKTYWMYLNKKLLERPRRWCSKVAPISTLSSMPLCTSLVLYGQLLHFYESYDQMLFNMTTNSLQCLGFQISAFKSHPSSKTSTSFSFNIKFWDITSYILKSEIFKSFSVKILIQLQIPDMD